MAKRDVQTQLLEQMVKNSVSSPLDLPANDLAILRLRAAADALESGEAVLNKFEHNTDEATNRISFTFEIEEKK